MKYATVSALCEGVAGAIRAKEGSTEKINPQDFVERIENLQVGGGTSEGNIEYLDVSGLSAEERGMISLYLAMYARGVHDDGAGNKSLMVASLAAFANGFGLVDWGQEISAIAIDLSAEVILSGNKMTVSEVFPLVSGGIDLASIPRITKEQFYTLE